MSDPTKVAQPIPTIPTASEWVLRHYETQALGRMRKFVNAYPKICLACCGEPLPENADASKVCDFYSLMIANNRAMRDIFEATYGKRPHETPENPETAQERQVSE